jgi:hypothetical protein
MFGGKCNIVYVMLCYRYLFSMLSTGVEELNGCFFVEVRVTHAHACVFVGLYFFTGKGNERVAAGRSLQNAVHHNVNGFMLFLVLDAF